MNTTRWDSDDLDLLISRLRLNLALKRTALNVRMAAHFAALRALNAKAAVKLPRDVPAGQMWDVHYYAPGNVKPQTWQGDFPGACPACEQAWEVDAYQRGGSPTYQDIWAARCEACGAFMHLTITRDATDNQPMNGYIPLDPLRR